MDRWHYHEQRIANTTACGQSPGSLEWNNPVGGVSQHCLPELDKSNADKSTFYPINPKSVEPVGEDPYEWPYWTDEQLGSAPSASSAHVVSMRGYPTAGYVAVIVPFFSEVWLPEERGLVEISGTTERVRDDAE